MTSTPLPSCNSFLHSCRSSTTHHVEESTSPECLQEQSPLDPRDPRRHESSGLHWLVQTPEGIQTIPWEEYDQNAFHKNSQLSGKQRIHNMLNGEKFTPDPIPQFDISSANDFPPGLDDWTMDFMAWANDMVRDTYEKRNAMLAHSYEKTLNLVTRMDDLGFFDDEYDDRSITDYCDDNSSFDDERGGDSGLNDQDDEPSWSLSDSLSKECWGAPIKEKTTA